MPRAKATTKKTMMNSEKVGIANGAAASETLDNLEDAVVSSTTNGSLNGDAGADAVAEEMAKVVSGKGRGRSKKAVAAAAAAATVAASAAIEVVGAKAEVKKSTSARAKKKEETNEQQQQLEAVSAKESVNKKVSPAKGRGRKKAMPLVSDETANLEDKEVAPTAEDDDAELVGRSSGNAKKPSTPRKAKGHESVNVNVVDEKTLLSQVVVEKRAAGKKAKVASAGRKKKTESILESLIKAPLSAKVEQVAKDLQELPKSPIKKRVSKKSAAESGKQAKAAKAATAPSRPTVRRSKSLTAANLDMNGGAQEPTPDVKRAVMEAKKKPRSRATKRSASINEIKVEADPDVAVTPKKKSKKASSAVKRTASEEKPKRGRKAKATAATAAGAAAATAEELQDSTAEESASVEAVKEETTLEEETPTVAAATTTAAAAATTTAAAAATAAATATTAPAAVAVAEKKSRGRKRAAQPPPASDNDNNNKEAEDEADGAKPAKPKAKKKSTTSTKTEPMNSTTTAYNKADFELPPPRPPVDDGQNGATGQPRFNLKISSWNVAGLRSWLKKDGLRFLEYEEPDIFCMQEIKCTSDQLPAEAARIPGYHPYWLCMPGGYAGVAIYSKIMPINVEYGIGSKEFDDVGRLITAEYEKFFLINVYVPNSGRKLVNLEARMRWETLFQAFVQKLEHRKPVVICGDMNVSHHEIDLANPKSNTRSAGFTREERDKMSELLALGYVDTFRHLYPTRKGAYTYWTYMGNARSRNVGWRLDYFIVSERFVGRVVDNCIRSQCMGSDHCPITLFLKL